MKFKLGVLSDNIVEVKKLKKGFDHDSLDLWAATLYINGKAIANFVPDGWGGQDRFYPTDRTPETTKLLDWFNQRAKRICTDYDFEQPQSLMHELIDATLSFRQVKRDMKTSIVFLRPDAGIGCYSYIKEGKLESVKQTFPDCTFADDLGAEGFVKHMLKDHLHIFNYTTRESKED